jgi:hypothetical protein
VRFHCSTHGWRPFDKLRASCGLYSFAATRLDALSSRPFASHCAKNCANFCPFVFDFSLKLDCLGEGAADTMRVLDCGLLFNISPRITMQGNHADGT